MKNQIILSLALSLFGSAAFAQLSQKPLQFWRASDQNGVNVFEDTKEDTVLFEGMQVRIGGAFTQQYQSLKHWNKATPVWSTDGLTNLNELKNIGGGFNNATANFNIDVQLDDGIRLKLETYLSARHHQETWVKGGYVQLDKMKFMKSALVDNIMNYVTIRAGHMEINYGDAHFRRTDNGNAMFNPLVGNYLLDVFTTEIAGEIYFKHKGIIAMFATSSGEIKGDVTNAANRTPALYGKLGYDAKITDNLRARLTGSLYTTDKAASNTLYAGDRAGSRYYQVLDNTQATATAQFMSGHLNPGFKNQVTSWVINPFVKFYGFEVFGLIEQGIGRASTEKTERLWNQYAVDVAYRFGSREQFYVAGRYNMAEGPLATGTRPKISAERYQGGFGWFVTKNILTKFEYVNQEYRGYPKNNILYGGKFEGFMIEGVVAF